MRISIALATYNGALHLTEQLQSYVEQERLPDELVVSDDGSDDETCSLIRRFSQTAPFEVQLLEHDVRLGYVGNFNRALSKCTGDLVFLSDQDDVWLPGKISELAEVAREKPDRLLMMNDAAITESELTATNLTKLGQLRSAGNPDSDFVMGSCCAIRRELLDLCLPIPEGARGHDNWIVNFSNGLEATFVLEKVLQLYRRHGGNESKVIANSTRKINRLDRLKLQLRKAYSSEADSRAMAEIQYLELLRHGCSRALGKSSGNYDSRIRQYDARLERQLALLLRRRELRSKALYQRIYEAPLLWLNGGYREANGLNSMIRDLIG